MYTRIDTVRRHLDAMINQNPDRAARRNGYVHLYGVGLAAALIALKRGYDQQTAELAEMAGMLHDYVSYQHPAQDREDHAHLCEPVVRALLGEMAVTTAEETDLICSAIYHHSDKDAIDSPFDEILKDADVMQHWLRNPAEPLFRERERVMKLCAEFGLTNFKRSN